MSIYRKLADVLGLGLQPADLTFLQISLRGIIVFLAALVMLRVADRRFMAKLSAFDTLLSFVLASMLARAINGSSAFFPTLGGGFVLVVIHRFFAMLAFHWEWFAVLIKGRPVLLVSSGKCDPQTMKARKISEDDLLEEARLNGPVGEVAEIKTATMERSGQISILSRDKD